MDQRKTLTAAPVSVWVEGLSELAKDRLALALIVISGGLALAWALVAVLLAWEVSVFMA